MTRRTPLLLLAAAAALVAIVVVGVTQQPDDKSGDVQPVALADQERALAGAPAPLAALHAQANDLLGGGTKALRARLRALRGHPVVVNKWASWCGPCRAEFVVFQHVGSTLGKRVAFVGLNSSDGDGAARSFLRVRPVSYPSYTDPKSKAAFALGTGTNFPVTVFYDAAGKRRFVHAGVYVSVEDLERDVRRYALS